VQVTKAGFDVMSAKMNLDGEEGDQLDDVRPDFLSLIFSY